jgi:hypothetical protein
MTFKIEVATCIGCDQPVSVHPSIEDRIACESAQQTRVRAELDAAAAAEPKRDGRFLARNGGARRCRHCGEPEDSGQFGWFDHHEDGLVCNSCGQNPLKVKRTARKVRS